MWQFFVTCVLLLNVVSCDPIVKITKGAIKGQILKSRDGRDYYSFTGIPFAKPPIGELRFKPPEPVDSWQGTLDATQESKMCIQKNVFFESFKHFIYGQEDCLYLNVHTPNINGKFPVMLWIHGGGFTAGGSSIYGPNYFMDKDVVFVSLNYRLGLLGFLSTEDDVLPGNNGLKDQVMALRWVQENIAKFGGDPEQVTIFGESAGGASTGYHLLSPMSKGLFHKVILQSGSPMCRWAIATPGVIRKRAEAVATIAGCYVDTSEDILNCLKKLSANSLIDIQNRLFHWTIHPCILFPPVVESGNSNQEAFLLNHPISNFKQESFVPMIIGFNSAEGGIFASSLYNDTSLIYPEVQSDFNRIMASILVYDSSALPEHRDEIGKKLMEMYFPSGRMDDHTHKNAVELLGDGTFLTCIFDMATKLSSPVYLYLFDYQNEHSFNKLYGGCEKPLGVSHGDEMINLFDLSDIIPNELNKKDADISKLMVNIWVKFASSKTPTIDGTDNGLAWPKFVSIQDSSILHIESVQPKITKNPFEEKYKFWSELPLFSRLDKLTKSNVSANKNEL